MKRDIELEATLVAKYAVVVPVLDERSRRRWAAAESLAIGYGGDLPPVPIADVVGGCGWRPPDSPVEVVRFVDVDGDALTKALAGGAHGSGRLSDEAVRKADERLAAA